LKERGDITQNGTTDQVLLKKEIAEADAKAEVVEEGFRNHSYRARCKVAGERITEVSN
jgi:hypothetical protein